LQQRLEAAANNVSQNGCVCQQTAYKNHAD